MIEHTGFNCYEIVLFVAAKKFNLCGGHFSSKGFITVYLSLFLEGTDFLIFRIRFLSCKHNST